MKLNWKFLGGGVQTKKTFCGEPLIYSETTHCKMQEGVSHLEGVGWGRNRKIIFITIINCFY